MAAEPTPGAAGPVLATGASGPAGAGAAADRAHTADTADTADTAHTAHTARWRLRVQGIVQGVGFRPFVYRLAQELGLAGWVRNDAAGVTLEAEGPPAQLRALARRLRDDAPPLARVDAVRHEPLPPGAPPFDGFAITASAAGAAAATAIGPDTAPCDACLREMLDPADRRWRHAFINCTHCGPRFTITRGLPYDRAMTSMAGFTQCPACLAEYRDPGHRRFHAEPNACPVCGPRLAWCGPDGRPRPVVDPLAAAVEAFRAGQVVAVKGLGGFHLACDARQPAAVAALRARKAREEKPFAVMVAGLASLGGLADCGPAEAARLRSPERPIVLLPKAAGCDVALSGVAPGLAWLGVMLPCTPLQVLLFHEAAGRPAGTDWLQAPQPLVLVMTSANPGGEPIVTGDAEAFERLAGIADAWLVHDRDIVQRCDDSVVRVLPGSSADAPAFQFIRRARGDTPRALRLARGGAPVLALGGFFKNTACALRADEAFLTPHVGELDNAATCQALDDAVAHLLHLLALQPAVVAHDLHPDFYSTRLAQRLAGELGAELCPVQHHHAHVAAVLAEHRLDDGSVLGLALDGVGLGTDGGAWGGELLRVSGTEAVRLGHLQPLRLPGGDRAAREPWRVAAAVLADAGREDLARARLGMQSALPGVLGLLARGLQCPPTSSLGRWFDAAAAVLGVRQASAFEGQAAMLLEGLAEAHGPVSPEPEAVAWPASGPDLTPLIVALAQEPDAARGAARFHATLARALADWVIAAAEAQGLSCVAGAGGCLLNVVLARAVGGHLQAAGLRWLQARAVPPNDGGLALGQAWVARLRHG